MRHFLTMIALFPLLLRAQETPQREKLDRNAVYETALRSYIQDHPDHIAATGNPAERIVLVKKQDYTLNLKDTLGGVTVKYIDPATDAGIVAPYFPKKKKLVVLDMQRIVSRGAVSYIWIIPMKTTWHPGKKKLMEPVYEDSLCEYRFEYSVQGDIHYFLKDPSCKGLK